MYAINIKQRGGRKKDTAVNVIFRFYYDIDDNTGSSRSSTTADINTIVGCNVWGKRERERDSQEKNSEICTYAYYTQCFC